jgi:hypothetical protein
LAPASINISDDASTATTFTFDTPVFLRNQTDYAIVIVPAGNSDQYAVWTAKLGGTDVFRPSTLINKQPASGVLFSSSNDKTWNPIQDEDLKFNLYRANFSTSTGTVYIENKENDYFSVDNLFGSFRVGETLRSESVLTFANTCNQSRLPVGTVLQSKSAYDGDSLNDSQFANGVIRQIVSNTATTMTVKLDALGTFPTTATGNENRLFLPGNSAFVGTTSAFSANTATGTVSFYNGVKGKLFITASQGGFANGWVRGMKSGAAARVTSVDNLVMNAVVPKIPVIRHSKTNATWEVRTTSTSGTISSTWEPVELGEDNNFYDAEKKVYSKTNEDGLSAVNGSKKTLVMKGTMSTTSPLVSPVIDTTRTNAIILGNIINNDSTDEQKNNGNASVRYISKKVTLADGQDAEDMLVYVNAFKPQGTDIKVYARLLNGEDGESFTDKDFTLMTQVTASNTYSSGFDGTDIKEFEFGFSANTDGQGFLTAANNQARLNTGNNNVVAYRGTDGSIYHTYKTFAIKIVMTSSGTQITPLVDDLRVIALQK